MTTEATRNEAAARTQRLTRAVSLAAILLALTACASSQQQPPELSRRGQAELQRVIPMSGMP